MSRGSPSNAVIFGGAVTLFGGIVLGTGMHAVISTGTCSSTGYSANLGPVPTCPSGTGLYILYLVGGIFVLIAGSLLAGGSSVTGAAVFLGIGLGAMSAGIGPWSHHDSRAFGLLFGGAFAVSGLVWMFFGLRSSLGGSSSSMTRTFAASGLAGLGTAPGVATPAPAPASGDDALERVQQLASLHDQGLVTDAEFEQRKREILGEH